MFWVLKHGLFSSPRKLSLWPKKCTFLLTPWPAVRDTQTFPLKAKRAETREDWLFWGVMEALILLPTPLKNVSARPRELLTFRCSALWFMEAAALQCECCFFVSTAPVIGKMWSQCFLARRWVWCCLAVSAGIPWAQRKRKINTVYQEVWSVVSVLVLYLNNRNKKHTSALCTFSSGV